MPLPTAEELEQQYNDRVRAQLQDLERARFVNPDRDAWLERVNIWVAYVWTPMADDFDVGTWLLAGFRRRRHRRKPQSMNQLFSKVRRQLLLEKKSPVLLLDLEEAARRARSGDSTWCTVPPQFQERTPELVLHTPTVARIKRKPATRVKAKAYVLNPRTTKFLALGRRLDWNRDPGFLYLGPLASTNRRLAEFEAKRLFNLYTELIVLGIDEISEPLRDAMARSKRVRAGVTRITWPEVPPEYDQVWSLFIKKERKYRPDGWINMDEQQLAGIGEDLRAEWNEQRCPWITLKWFRAQTKYWREACEPEKSKPRKKPATVASPRASASSSKTAPRKRRSTKSNRPSPKKTRKIMPAKRKARSGRSLRVSATLSVIRTSTTPTNRGTPLRVKAVAKLIEPPAERLIQFGKRMFFAVLQPKR